ncbi:MAG: DUF547 domain-containing protein [Alphaproteobacteria bacterium]|nr:DUF547 domain-containing protein [Alphaproteobacteria bacterium]MCB9791493.1 DUF547 domain-containing protein [Alphaproteobacteria bacterium]
MLILSLLGAALAFDHGYAQLDATFTAHVKAGRVDYKAIGPAGLDPVLEAFAGADLSGFSRDQQMAFWINAYNALTVDMMAENPGVGSIRDLDGGDPWSKRSFTVAGRQVTLNAIEHEILRPMGDARIHAAVNCASIGCPPLRRHAFTPDGLDAQLEKASRGWVIANAVSVGEGEVKLNQIFDWYGDDFIAEYGDDRDIPGVEGKQEAALNFIIAHANEELAAQLSKGGYSVGYSTYNWSLNKR